MGFEAPACEPVWRLGISEAKRDRLVIAFGNCKRKSVAHAHSHFSLLAGCLLVVMSTPFGDWSGNTRVMSTPFGDW